MSLGDGLAIAVVAACALWVGLRAWRRLRRRGDCGCDHCPDRQK